ncbi:hypothetical protein niasHT_019760 [Heterodera trifolii]|uniref:Uncharacterized protein n=1 Tax=Heterodera trifolii TaxID=157864 RepID=A0ABD2LC61_9BILA
MRLSMKRRILHPIQLERSATKMGMKKKRSLLAHLSPAAASIFWVTHRRPPEKRQSFLTALGTRRLVRPSPPSSVFSNHSSSVATQMYNLTTDSSQ